MTDMKRIDIIAGPTASGKSALALSRACAENGVIINADSMQIYDALPILTARPTAEDMRVAPHFLYAALSPDEPCNAQSWRDMAAPVIETALQKGHRPIVVGGTGLYINALLHGLSPMPVIPESIRADAMKLQQKSGNPGFHACLHALDPVMASRLHPNDTQRLIRAYEVVKATGKSLADWQNAPREAPPPSWQFHVTLVLPERGLLYDRCNKRFDQMIEDHGLGEVAHFHALNPSGDLPVANALGYKDLTRYLDGTVTLDEAIIQAKAQTRHYAKRQVTWFRHQIQNTNGVMAIDIVPSPL
jgi:tRNA dimethylallyltransferase